MKAEIAEIMTVSGRLLAGIKLILAGLVAVFALAAFAGWFGLFPETTRLGVGTARTSAATAVALLLAATAILVTSAHAQASRRFETLSSACAAAVLIVGLIALGGYGLGLPQAGYLLGADMGRVSIATGSGLSLLAVALLAANARAHSTAASLCVLGLLVCETAIVGYVFGVASLAKIFIFSSMALPTALTLSCLFLAVALIEPRRSWVRYLIQGNQASIAFWLMMPATVVIPFVSAGLVVWSIKVDALDPAFGLAVLAVSMTIVLGLIVMMTCIWLARSQRVAARLVAIVASSSAAIIGKSLEGVITDWNPAAERMFGYTEAEAIGKTMHIIIPEERADEERDILGKIRNNESVAHFETVRQRKDGSQLHVSATVSPMRLANGEILGIAAIMRDITERKLKDEELMRSNAELEQFAYIASHDLQEPLRMVANYVELLADRYRGKLDEKADKFIYFAVDGARRMQQLVSDLLAYSRIGSQGRPLVPVNLAKVIDHVVRSLQGPIAASGATIETGDLPWVEGDEVQLGQLFQNLIANAIKFRAEAAPVIRIAAVRQGRKWTFSIADNGIGMDMRYADRIFQMFQRLNERGKYAGSGIGLALAKRIVERHAGNISVDSEPNHGTTFQFTLNAVLERRD